MARRRSLWAELQRERADRQRREVQARRAIAQSAARTLRERELAQRAAARQAAATDRERKRLYIEERKASAIEMTASLEARIAELDSVLVDGVADAPGLMFKHLRRAPAVRPFDPAGLDRPIPEPLWADFDPPPPSAVGRLFGGSARYGREMAAARDAYERARGQHAVEQVGRREQLASRRREHERRVAGAARSAAAHNAEIDDFEKDYQAGDPEAVAEFLTLTLDASVYPEGFARRMRVLYRPQPREAVVEYELPAFAVIPAERVYKYVQTRDEIDALARPSADRKERYARLIAAVTLRTIAETFAADDAGVVSTVTVNGMVLTTDQATGQPVRPCLISVSAPREKFATFVLPDVNPVACLGKLNALMSDHPSDLEAVRPVADFEILLKQYKFVEGMDAVAGLDSRRDLLDMTPTEFEHLVRQLFEAMGMKSWNTQASKDDGVDAVAVNDDYVFGGTCIIQAKRYRGPVGVEAVRELAGVMGDKRATTGVLVTTAWVTKDGHAFAERHGRTRIIECEELKYLCREHLGEDVLISLPKKPPQRRK